jgi:hypothetical protein
MSQNTTDEFFKTLFLDILQVVHCFLLKCGNDFLIMECVPYLFCFNIVPQKGLVMEYWRCHGFVWNLYYVGLFHPVIGDSGGPLLRVSLGCCARVGNDWATHRWQSKRLVFIYWIGFLIIGNGLFKPNMTSIIFERLS